MAGRVASGSGIAAGAVPGGGADLGPGVVPPHLSLTAVARLRPWLTYPAWTCCLALTVLAPLFPALAVRWQWYPFALGLVLLGLPHGAMDHLAIPLLERRPLTLRFFVSFFAGYLGLVLLYLAFWRAAPVAAMVGFLVVSCLHWGQGDAYYLRAFEGHPRPAGAVGTDIVWLVRGGLPILLPVLAFPAVYAQVATGLTAWYGGADLPAPGHVVVTVGIGVLLALGVVYAVRAWHEDGPGRRGAWRRDIGELLLLAALFARVPPPLAVGTYFCVWHSARHLGRLMLADPATTALLVRGQTARAFARTAFQCLPLTLGALGLLGGLYAVQHTHGIGAALSLPGLVFLYLSLIAALTVPHFLVVLWMDRKQGV